MLQKEMKKFEFGRIGSALIMTVVLTVLLAIVAVMFVAVARMDMASTGNIADNKALESSVKSIVEIINRQLVLDTPGVEGQEYYDYPDANNIWLASIEPYRDSTNPAKYYWRQISDVTNFLHQHGYPTNNVDTDPCGSTVIKDYPEIKLNADGSIKASSSWADADGDGIADSKWFELANMRSSKGKPIYAAVRIIDNSAMVNINTAHEFNANDPNISEIDGSSQMQINLKGLLKGTPTEIDNQYNALLATRCGTANPSRNSYTQNVIWRYGEPNGNYTPFDISDELELRYRYCIDSKFISRFEVNCPQTAEGAGTANFGSLYNTDTSNQPNNPCASNWRLSDWQRRITLPDDCKADRRHLLTTLNLDRIIDPCGIKMTNINDANVYDINNLFTKITSDADVSAQIVVNIIDYRDSNSEVTVFQNPDTGKYYYGFERPCIYISELAFQSNGITTSYAIELYNPYNDQIDAGNGWKLTNGAWTVNPINWSGTGTYYLIVQGGAFAASTDQTESIPFNSGETISLTRHVGGVGGTDIVVDSVDVPGGWMTVDGSPHSFQRDDTVAKCMRRLWDTTHSIDTPTLKADNSYNTNTDANFIQAHPANSDFNNIGQIGMIFRKAAYYPLGGSKNGIIGYTNDANEEYQVRLNLTDPNFQKIFRYLTVWPPSYVSDQNETKIKGRININTAPTYVLAQLPWVSLRKNNYNDPNLAQAIVAYRDKMAISGGPDYRGSDPCGFRSIGELCNVNRGSDPNFGIDYYSRGIVGDQNGPPDLTPDDNAPDDFEERDLIFTRISNLVTVRSDVFTAYILVRVCTNLKDMGTYKLVEGPQKRCIAILDRSRVKDVNDRVYIRAFQTTPEAR